MYLTKRRRTDGATSALTRPFRSPLHVDPNKQKPSSEKQNDPSAQAATCITPPVPSNSGQTVSSPTQSPTSATFLTQTTSRQPRLTQSSPIRPPSSSRTSTRDEEYIALQKQHSALTLQLKDLSASLDSATQALKIVQSRQDDDLERLIQKWRSASRDAAEELFSTAKDRVNRMGGVGAWRERYMKPPEDSSWADEPGFDEDDLTDEQKEQLDIAREEARAESEKYGLHQEHPLANVKDDDSFTIGMMLKQLNVDLEIIGYDTKAQRWSD